LLWGRNFHRKAGRGGFLDWVARRKLGKRRRLLNHGKIKAKNDRGGRSRMSRYFALKN